MSRARIHKAAKSQYAAIPNAIAQSRTLSPAARAVLIELLSRPDDWQTRPDQLAYEHLSVRKVYRVLNELIDAGYVVRTAERGDDGKIVTWRYDVFDAPTPLAKTDEVENSTKQEQAERKSTAVRARTHFVANGTHTKTEEEQEETNPAPTLELPDHVAPAARRVLTYQAQPDGGAKAYTLIEAYCDAWDVTAQRYRDIWHRKHLRGANDLAALDATPDEIKAMVAERRANGKQPDECPMAFLAMDYVGWKVQQAAKPKPRQISDIERAAQEKALEAERIAWRKEQGLL